MGAKPAKRQGLWLWSPACTRARRALRNAGRWSIVHTPAEVDWEMKAISVLFVLFVMAMAVVVAAQPVNPVGALPAPEHGMEPVWMVLSGAALLALASVVRRYIP